MANVLLVTYSGYIKTPSSLALDNGLANLAGALIDAGHVAQILDLNTLSTLRLLTPHGFFDLAKLLNKGSDRSVAVKRIQTIFDEHQEHELNTLFEQIVTAITVLHIDVIGFKCWGSEGSVAIKNWLALIRASFPEIKILLGGPVCQVMPEHAARYFSNFDFMALGEAEKTIVGIIDHIEKNTPITTVPGLLYKNNGVFKKTAPDPFTDLNQLPRPRYDRHVYPSAWTGDKLNMVVLDESRGCPNRCHFCVHPTYAFNRRTKSVSRLLEEIKQIQATLGTVHFRMAGSNTPGKYIHEFSKAVLEQQIDLKFSCFAHVEDFEVQSLSMLHKAGLRSIFFGIETADEALSKKVCNKAVSSDKAEQVIKNASSAGIFCTGSFIYPLPFQMQNPESRAKTFDFIKRVFGNNPHASAQFLNPFPLPNTKWWTEKEKFGFEFDEDEYLLRNISIVARHMFPPEMQDFLPYKLDGKSHFELATELSTLMNELVPHGVAFNISDDVALIGIGCDESPIQFRNEMMPAFLYGGVDRVSMMVEKFNRATKTQPFFTDAVSKTTNQFLI